jgi:hypothetical protein
LARSRFFAARTCSKNMVFKTTDIGRLILEAVSSNQSTTVKTSSVSYSHDDAIKIAQGLSKVASFPYKEEAYQSTKEMMKIASQCIESMVHNLEESQARVQELEKAASVRNLLDDMLNAGMTDDSDVHEKIAELSKKTPRELEVIKEAIKLAAHGKGMRFFEEAKDSDGSSMVKRGMFDDIIGTD